MYRYREKEGTALPHVEYLRRERICPRQLLRPSWKNQWDVLQKPTICCALRYWGTRCILIEINHDQAKERKRTRRPSLGELRLRMEQKRPVWVLWQVLEKIPRCRSQTLHLPWHGPHRSRRLQGCVRVLPHGWVVWGARNGGQSQILSPKLIKLPDPLLQRQGSKWII